MYSTDGSIKLKAMKTSPGANTTQPPLKWKFQKEDYASIREEYNVIRQKSSLKSTSPATIGSEHRAFADKYPQLYMMATSPSICDKNVHLLLRMSEIAQQQGKNDMDTEAAFWGQKISDEHANPSRKQ